MIHKIKNIALLSIFLISSVAMTQNAPLLADQNLRRTAEALEQAGQYENAADYYSRAVRVNPKDIAAYHGAKRCFEQVQDFDQFEKLIFDLQSKQRDLRYSVDLAWIEYQRGNTSKAQKMWKTIIEENSKRHETYSLIGRIYVENQMYDEAIELYLDGRKNTKNDLAYMFELTNIYKILDEQDKLATEYVTYLAAFPQQLDFLSAELQRFVQTQENINPLLKALQKSLKSQDDPNWIAHFFLMDIYTFQQDYENALLHCAELERILANSPVREKIRSYAEGKFLHECAQNALSNDAVDYAERAFTILIDEFPKSRYVSSAKLGLARVYTSQQQYEKALEALQLFVDQNKRSAESRLALLQMGDIAYFQLFDMARAEQAYNRALREFPNVNFQIETLFRLADCAMARDDLDAAEGYLQRAFKLSEPNPMLNGAALMHLAWLEFYRMHPTASLRYVEDFSNIVFPTNQTNVFENDAIELSMLLQNNLYDSTGLAILGKASLFLKQREFDKAKELLETYLQENSNSQLKSELRLRLVDVYKKLYDFQPAVALLDSVYADSTSFYRDSALLSSAEIYEKELASPLLAQERYEKILIEFPMSIYLDTAHEKIRELESQQ